MTSLFFLWGIPNNLNDVLIRQFMKSFAISRFQAGLIQSGTWSYFVQYVHDYTHRQEKVAGYSLTGTLTPCKI